MFGRATVARRFHWQGTKATALLSRSTSPLCAHNATSRKLCNGGTARVVLLGFVTIAMATQLATAAEPTSPQNMAAAMAPNQLQSQQYQTEQSQAQQFQFPQYQVPPMSPPSASPAGILTGAQQVPGNYGPQGYPVAPPAGAPAPPGQQGAVNMLYASADGLPGQNATPVGNVLGNIQQTSNAAAAPYYAQFASQQPGGPQGEVPPSGMNVSPSDILQRLQAAEAELNAMRQQMEPRDKRLHELEDASQKLAAAAVDQPLPLIRLSGFFQYDTGWFSQDAQSKETLGNIQNGSGFRRTRLQGLGQLTEFTTFSIEMDFAFPGRPSFMDVWGEQSNLPFIGHARIGQYRQPVTMDSWTNIKHLEFLERSAPFIAFDPFRRVGIMGWDNSEDERTMWAYSLFSTGTTFWNTAPASNYSTLGNDDRFGTQIGDSGGIAFATRGTHLLYYDPNSNNRYLMHVGGGYLFGEIGGQGTTGSFAKTYEARSIPEFFVGDQAGGFVTAAGTPNVVDTGRFLASNYQMLHAEVAGSYGSAHYQAEYMAQFVNQRGGGMVFYDGGYVQGGYFLTGENTGYNKLMGALDYNVKPNSPFFGTGRKKSMGGWGAWEVAARWSWLDLNSTKVRADNFLTPTPGPPSSQNPGVLNEPTVALNWWWNEYMRVQLNYIHSMVTSPTVGLYATDIYSLRFQTEF
jgi:phosphate-selective porin OprO and OprP